MTLAEYIRSRNPSKIEFRKFLDEIQEVAKTYSQTIGSEEAYAVSILLTLEISEYDKIKSRHISRIRNEKLNQLLDI